MNTQDLLELADSIREIAIFMPDDNERHEYLLALIREAEAKGNE